jgi:hypothetical protein
MSAVATAKDGDVPSSWRTCHQDSDCSLIVRCGSCCPDDAINNEKIEVYRNIYRQECKNPRPPCPCVYRKAICQQGVCDIGSPGP